MTAEPKAVQRADFLSLRDCASLQRERWVLQSAYVAASSAFYGSLWDGRPLDPRLDALEVLPFTDKEMLRGDQAAHPPFGRYLAAEPARIRILFMPSFQGVRGLPGSRLRSAPPSEDCRQEPRWQLENTARSRSAINIRLGLKAGTP